MIDFVDIQYAQHLAGRLELFRIRNTNPYKINFRCPICGDSQKSRTKARGWLLEKENNFYFYCHNCSESHSFSNFLKAVDPLAYNDYVAEKFIKKGDKTTTPKMEKFKTETPTFARNEPLKKIKKISQLSHNHPVKKYIEKRRIPPAHHYRLFYVQKFKEWVNKYIPDKFDNLDKDEPRLIIPFLDEDKNIFGCSARSFDPNTKLRYISIMFEDRPKIFGLDKVNFNREYFVVEGALDSMFLSNAVAMAGADGGTDALRVIKNATFVFDNEPRNKEIHKRMEKVIEQGYKICIWPNLDGYGKDINEMVLNGMTNVETVIRDNTFQGLNAKLKLTEWRKI
jgi:transcription elongation factor Elf1